MVTLVVVLVFTCIVSGVSKRLLGKTRKGKWRGTGYGSWSLLVSVRKTVIPDIKDLKIY